jgi:hypothetical protein
MTPDCRAGAAAQPGSARRLRVIERQGRRRLPVHGPATAFLHETLPGGTPCRSVPLRVEAVSKRRVAWE